MKIPMFVWIVALVVLFLVVVKVLRRMSGRPHSSRKIAILWPLGVAQ